MRRSDDGAKQNADEPVEGLVEEVGDGWARPSA